MNTSPVGQHTNLLGIDTNPAAPSTPTFGKNARSAQMQEDLTRAAPTNADASSSGFRRRLSVDASPSDQSTGARIDDSMAAKRLRTAANLKSPSEVDNASENPGAPEPGKLANLGKSLARLSSYLDGDRFKSWARLFEDHKTLEYPLSPEVLVLFLNATDQLPESKTHPTPGKFRREAVLQVLDEVIHPFHRHNTFEYIAERIGVVFEKMTSSDMPTNFTLNLMARIRNNANIKSDVKRGIIYALWEQYDKFTPQMAPVIAAEITVLQMPLAAQDDRMTLWENSLEKAKKSDGYFSPLAMAEFINALGDIRPIPQDTLTDAHDRIAKLVLRYPDVQWAPDQAILRGVFNQLLAHIKDKDARADVTLRAIFQLKKTPPINPVWIEAIKEVIEVPNMLSADKVTDIKKAIADLSLPSPAH